MKLDRNINPDGRGKYALVRLRFRQTRSQSEIQRIEEALRVLSHEGVLDFGNTRDTEFFVIRLKDKYASFALKAYSDAAFKDDHEYGQEILNLAARAASGPGRMPD